MRYGWFRSRTTSGPIFADLSLASFRRTLKSDEGMKLVSFCAAHSIAFFDGQWIALQSHGDAIDRRADLVHLDRFCRHSLVTREADDRHWKHKFEFAIGMILLPNSASTKMLARNMRVTEDGWGVIRSLRDGAASFRSLPL
ncbi:hypothetical protein RBWH47_03411 [Rhodopirellula baltica WH47]|uniref:Uncharacterized protein n=1 Tax=Rhodopirellula baltica WH47 TaxID=991778 RepID=F2AZG0_RHOBT|nr:hypothetical protein RBWH47_03411 [Rhodopirellula baltica WH47]